MHRLTLHQYSRLGVACGVIVCLLLASRAANAQDVAIQNAIQNATRNPTQQHRLQAIADELRGRLEIVQDVNVAIVPVNTLLMSVEPVERVTPRVFTLKVQGDFAAGLGDAELSAAIAHELGHVWIFTHHPYLQTEQLANQIAMRLVSRDALAELYDKVWKRVDATGDLARFLGPVMPAGLASNTTP